MNGWLGAIVHVDLTAKTWGVEHLDGAVYEAWIGGKGLAGMYLDAHVTRSWDDPAMPLIFMAGPLVGTASPTSGRMCVMSRSPLTGTIGDASVGGSFGTQLKKAGFDGIVFTGRAAEPSGVVIEDGRVAFAAAGDLTGLSIGARHERLKAGGAVACIGPAAENGVRFACIVVDGGFFVGRNGLGLCMAAKNLGFVTVKGTGHVGVHDREGLLQAREDIFRLIAGSPVLFGQQGLIHYGTGAIYDLMHSRRMMPTRNFRDTYFEPAPGLNAVAYKNRYGSKRAGCRGCHIQCKQVTPDGAHLPEFETMSHFSALIDNADIDVVTRANTLCGELGMDTITAAATLACFAEIECERLDGSRVLGLLEDIGRGRGLGSELAAGSYSYACAHGHPELSMSVKGQELAAYDPRGAYGMALAYTTSTRGGCHLRAYPISHEILRKPVATDRFSFAGKARIVKIAEDANAVVDSLIACKFVFFAASLEEYAKAYTAVTGVASSAQDLLRIGERIYYRERIMNARNGFSAEQDDLPRRFFEEPGTSGNAIEIRPIDRAQFLEARSNYYRVRGLDELGRPTSTKARELGLDWPPLPTDSEHIETS
ncbi:MAG TPA: aldehyde ferredoxin oxidoreductase family protein [Candidatus Hydrogenedentes bacterium]|nr:aldehyde ferredoxin oxidoreductase family protein [Candidatus Hydrogenedentota bacterium]HPG70059.1 aldehyde ferredoxin oxidoreductase family protein [Candidatus Hydrogenedentota bacterium]